jgi:hypothetical protein
MSTCTYLDLVPKGRGEDALTFTMSQLRHHDPYADGDLADAEPRQRKHSTDIVKD